MSATKAEAVIYSQAYKHRGHEFQAWSYLDDPEPQKYTMRFAFRVGGVTVGGLSDREEAIRKARERIDELPPEPTEETPAADPSQAIQAHPPQQAELALG